MPVAVVATAHSVNASYMSTDGFARLEVGITERHSLHELIAIYALHVTLLRLGRPPRRGHARGVKVHPLSILSCATVHLELPAGDGLRFLSFGCDSNMLRTPAPCTTRPMLGMGSCGSSIEY